MTYSVEKAHYKRVAEVSPAVLTRKSLEKRVIAWLSPLSSLSRRFFSTYIYIKKSGFFCLKNLLFLYAWQKSPGQRGHQGHHWFDARYAVPIIYILLRTGRDRVKGGRMTEIQIFNNVMEWAFDKGGDYRELQKLYFVVDEKHKKRAIATFFLRVRLILEKGFILNLSPDVLKKIGLCETAKTRDKKINNFIETLNSGRHRVSYFGEFDISINLSGEKP